MGDSKDQVLGKIGAFVSTRFGGDYRKAFDYYDKLTTQNGKVDKEAVMQLLQDSSVDTKVFGVNAPGKYAATMIKELDLNGDGEVDWAEFESKFKEE